MLSRYEQVHQELLNGLRAGRWRAGEQLPPLPVLAAQLGASTWSTERALTMLINEGLLSRRPKKGTYVRQCTAEEAYRQAPVAVAGVGPERWLVGDYLGPLLGAFVAEVGARDWIFLHTRELPTIVERLRLLGAPALVAVTPSVAQLPALERLAAEGLPVLCLGARVQSARLHCVAVDNQQGVKAGLRYLADLGHRRVAFICSDTGALDTRDRMDAFRQGVAELGLDAAPALQVCSDTAGNADGLVNEAVSNWFADGNAPTAIFSGGNSLTEPLLQALAARGISFPDDVSIIAFDDAPLLAHLAAPLTVVRQPLAEMGRRAAQLLPLLPAHAGAPMQLVLPAELIVRASCAPPRGGNR